MLLILLAAPEVSNNAVPVKVLFDPATCIFLINRRTSDFDSDCSSSAKTEDVPKQLIKTIAETLRILGKRKMRTPFPKHDKENDTIRIT